MGKVWGITAERVRQIERAALATMREANQEAMAA
ncbi:sigma factor-like helix-turn-helix DNA-binding protein [Streptococcus pseudopneumoniae]